MRDWSCIEPKDVRCPTMLLVGTKNKDTFDWVKTHRAELDSARIRVELVEGLNHLQEVTEIDRVFPIVHSFFADSAAK